MIKAGVIGAGHLGKIHLKLLDESNFFKLIGYFDVKKNKENRFVYFETIEKLIKLTTVDGEDFKTPVLKDL